MSNAQELLSILGGRHRPALSTGTSSNPQEKSILQFKAGKMTTQLQPNGKYLVTPDTRRGELHLVWSTAAAAARGNAGAAAGGHVKIEWKDRRTKAVVNTVPVFPGEDATFERVETGREGDRVYLLQVGSGAEGRHFFWMQDRDPEPDEDLCVKVNLYLSDSTEAATAAGVAPPVSAAPAAPSSSANASTDGMDSERLLSIMQGALGSEGGRAVTAAVPGSGSVQAASPGQIDALGNILENLGIPPPGGTLPSGERAPHQPPSAGGLTLADLQGAMAGLATASPVSSPPGPPLAELASSDIIDESGILDDPEVTARLVALLPEGQRTNEQLRENLRSPQVAQCLQRLTEALADDASSFNSIIANFQLNPEDGAEALAAGNPIEAFLNCLLRDVERKEGVKMSDANENGETKDDGEGGEEKEGDDQDAKMDES
ncbi:hypothetical protein ACHAW6_005060 [Cyclotella cf. meneghiniana]